MKQTKTTIGAPYLSPLPAPFGFLVLRLLYDFAFLLVLILGLPFFLFRLLNTSRFRAGFAQRFGFVPKRNPARPCLWVHGVSVGETKAARPFVELFSARHPEMEIVISNTTAGGHALSEKLFPKLSRFYYPLDFSLIVRRVFNRISPSAIVLMELEIWPNFLIQARKRGIPVFVVNGKLSERSFRGYRKLNAILPQFRWVSLYSVQNETFARRFRELGVQDENIQITGNVKFDEVAIAPREIREEAELSRIFEKRKGEKKIVAGSTHPEEEKMLYQALQQLKSRGHSSLGLVLVPRHPDRTPTIVQELNALGAKPIRLTELRRLSIPLESEQVLIVDTFGELEKFYALADLVFVGGSLIPRGGHNVLEPAAMGKAVVVGPHTFNFVSEVSLLEESEAIVCVKDENELVSAMKRLFEDPQSCSAMGKRAIEIIRRNQGATARSVEAIESRIGLHG